MPPKQIQRWTLLKGSLPLYVHVVPGSTITVVPCLTSGCFLVLIGTTFAFLTSQLCALLGLYLIPNQSVYEQ